MGVYTDAELAEIKSLLNTASPALQAKLRSARTDQTLEALASVVGSSKGQGLSTAIASLVTVTVSNWGQLKTAANAADGAMFAETLNAAKAAWDKADNAAFGPALVTCFAAALKNFYGETPTP
jgi:3-methyladenine DNA glycosylase AlkD